MLKFPYTDGATSITAPATKVTDLPAGPIDHHWTKSLVASPDGSKLYVGVGSNSNIAENGIGAELDRAAVWEIDAATGAKREYATGSAIRPACSSSRKPGSSGRLPTSATNSAPISCRTTSPR